MLEHKPEDIIHIIENKNRQLIVAVWASLSKWSDEEVADRTGLPIGYCEKEVRFLKINNIIGDKGLINTYAIQYIRSNIVKAIKKQ